MTSYGMFDIFSPSTYFSFLSLNWLSAFCVFFLPAPFWASTSAYFLVIKYQMLMTYELVSNSFKTMYYPGLMGVFSCLVFFIFMNNLSGLFPFVFTSTSHMSFNLAIALPLWLGSVMMVWMYSMNSWLSHLTPSGAPMFLSPFLVVVELVSFMIRPLTLALRLTTNMVAGHVLLSLLSSPMTSAAPYFIPAIFSVVVVMLVLEVSVAYIQAYVFSTLVMLYNLETFSVNQLSSE